MFDNAKKYDAADYIVKDNPFYDGVQLHAVGERITWAGPPGNCLEPVESAGRRKSTTDAPIFADPLGGRGDGAAVAKGTGGPALHVQ